MRKKREKSILRDTIGLIILSVILKLVGFAYRIVVAYFYGTTNMTDIFYTATGFIEGMAEILLAGLTVGIINIYVKEQNQDNRNRFISNVLMFVEIVLILFGVLVFIFSKPFSRLLAPAYSDNLLDKLQGTIRILCIVFPFIGLISVWSAALQAEKKFTPVKLTGTIASAGSIVVVVLLSDKMDYLALVFASIITHILNALFLRVNLGKTFRFVPKNTFKDTALKELMKLSLPLIIALAATQVNVMVDKAVATTVKEGTVSCLMYGIVLYLVVENVIINSIVVALFPNLVDQRNHKDDTKVADTAFGSLILGLTVLIPISIAMFSFSEEIVDLAYMRGNFTYEALIDTSLALKGYTIGLPFLLLREVSIRIFYAYDDTKTPMVINLISVSINIVLDVLFARIFGIVGITLATSISIFLGSIIITVLSRKHNDLYSKNFSLNKILLLCIFAALEILLCYLVPAYNYLLIIIACFCIFFIQFISLRFIEPKTFTMFQKKLHNFTRQK